MALYQLVVLVSVLAVCPAQLVPAGTLAAEPYDAHPQYDFSYSVNDILTGDSKTQREQRDGDTVVGSYSLVEPDGVLRTVRYTADALNGFNAVVERGTPSVSGIVPDAAVAVRQAPLVTHPATPSATLSPQQRALPWGTHRAGYGRALGYPTGYTAGSNALGYLGAQPRSLGGYPYPYAADGSVATALDDYQQLRGGYLSSPSDYRSSLSRLRALSPQQRALGYLSQYSAGYNGASHDGTLASRLYSGTPQSSHALGYLAEQPGLEYYYQQQAQRALLGAAPQPYSQYSQYPQYSQYSQLNAGGATPAAPQQYSGLGALSAASLPYASSLPR